jgi:SAM-dependent methyltransferase
MKNKTERYIDKYMKEEYDRLDSENKFVGNFILKNTRGRVLDFGCGPNLLFWSIFMNKAMKIDAFDILPENIAYVKRVLNDKRKAPIYYKVLRYVQNISNNSGSYRLDDIIAKIQNLKIANMLDPLPFHHNFYDTVTEIGCIGCVSTYDELLAAVKTMYRHLRKGGRAIIVNWKDKQICKKREPVYFDGTVEISKEIFEGVFSQAGFRKVSIKYKRNGPALEYGTIIYGTAIK